MSKISAHIIDQIMQASQIEDVIGDFVNLKRAGSNLKGLSPFTDEKTPSFVVSPAKQIFKCFSTGKGGSVVTFLMEKEHFSYPEALRFLANKYGVQIPEESEPTAKELADKTERESLFIINEFAKNYFYQNLQESTEGKAVGLSYFEERGFTKETIEKFQLGYCLNVSDDFTKAALSKGYSLSYLEKVGLVKSKDERNFDFFRGRVLFPIQSISGRILGFGGRSLINDKKVAKYFNSPESIIYNKSEILYGLYFSKGEIVKYDECLLCEGYTDVISMHQSGIQNVVSSSGTSLTKEQVKLVKRYTKNLTILYDGDAAGIKASFRGIDLILEEGMNVKVVLFPDGEDPDSFAKKNSDSELALFIKEQKQDFITFKAQILLKDGENDPLKKSDLIREIVQSVGLIPDQITRSVYVKEIARQFDIEESIISNELMRLRRNSLSKQFQEPEFNQVPLPENDLIKSQETTDPTKEDAFRFKHEEELMRMMICFGTREIETLALDSNELHKTSVVELIHQELEQDLLTFEYPLFIKIYDKIIEGLNEKTFYTASYFKRIEDQEIVSFVSDIESREIELSTNWITKFSIFTKSESDDLYSTVMNIIYNFKYKKVEDHLLSIKSDISKGDLSDEDILLALGQQMLYENVKKVISEKLGRIILK
jgi:DNA primase